ncbi:hypothetical protein CC80DRAFT_243483 [Byssothecium circinans]|uniref:Methyltransferase domain-containing protein n=1 Tax=Byssothecium circinans TaxID=147558 RepID=A0A6A5TBZ9_9PLEO|nr:hypothetical protein CC80DRAFT_243483 [Byssothecium circinans]
MWVGQFEGANDKYRFTGAVSQLSCALARMSLLLNFGSRPFWDVNFNVKRVSSTPQLPDLSSHSLLCSLYFWTVFNMTLRSYVGRVAASAFIAVFFFITFLRDNTSTDSFISSVPSIPKPQRLSSPRKFASLNDRIALSEKSWENSVERRNKMIEAFPHRMIDPFPKKWQNEPGNLVLWDFFPASWTCPHDMQRIGRLGDGGKWVCGMSVYESFPAPASWSREIPAGGQEGVVIYSFGINGDSSFEAEMLERIPSARIWGYDFSVYGWGPQILTKHSLNPRTFFQKVGIGRTDEPKSNPPLYTLQSLMKANNHTYIDILKIDVEGSEFASLEAVMDHFSQESKTLPIGQVMIEIHANRKSISFPNFRRWWERLEGMGMRATWVELNLLRVTLFEGEQEPDCTEYVWVNAKDERSVLLVE